MVRDAAKEAAFEALEMFSKDVDLRLERSERRFVESIEKSIADSLEKYIGMSAIEHALSHQRGETAYSKIEQVEKAARSWFIRAILVGSLVAAGGVALQTKAQASTHQKVIEKAIVWRDERELRDDEKL